jgi:hypothetical protein
VHETAKHFWLSPPVAELHPPDEPTTVRVLGNALEPGKWRGSSGDEMRVGLWKALQRSRL